MPTSIKLSGTTIGSLGSYKNLGNTINKVFDGDVSTFFDAPIANGCWVGQNFGTLSIITNIEYCPRVGWNSRMVGGKFQGANLPDFSDAVDLFVITVPPLAGIYTSAPISNPNGFKYCRYLSPDNGYCNISEMRIWGTQGVQEPTPIPFNYTSTDPYPWVQDSHGWTIPPAPIHTFYIDGTNGNDLWPGTAAQPYKTTTKPLKYYQPGDAIYFKRGSVNKQSTGWLNKSCIVVDSYGDSNLPRPIMQFAASAVGFHVRSPNCMIRDMDFRGDNLSTKGLVLDANGLMVEGCTVTGHFQGIQINKLMKGIKVRRTNVSRNYRTSGSGHAQGFYIELAVNFIADECVINYNGWDGKNPTTSDVFQHGMYENDDGVPYLQDQPFAINNSIVADNGSQGILGRNGGTSDGCYFQDNSINGSSIIMGGPYSEIKNFVCTGALDAPARSTPRGYGINIGALNGSVHDGLCVNSRGQVGAAICVSQIVSNNAPLDQGTIDVYNVTVINWQGDGIKMDTVRKVFNIHDNKISVFGNTNFAVDLRLIPTTMKAANDSYANGSLFRIYGGLVGQDLKHWKDYCHEVVSIVPAPTKTDATIENYCLSIGLPASGEAFLKAAENNQRSNWNTQYTAKAVGDWFRSMVTLGK